MAVYLIWFIIIVAIYLFSLKRISIGKNVYMLGIYMLGIALFVGLGDMLGGYDRYIYAELFDNMADVINSGGSPFLSDSFMFYRSEFGYGAYCALLSQITANRYIFILITTLIIYTLIFFSIKDYAENYPFAIMIFMGFFFFFTFTYLRQVMGVIIAWFSVRYIIRREFIPFLIVIFVACSFHNSAIIFLPIYFIPIKKFSVRTVAVVMGICLLIGMSTVPSSLFEIYGEANENRINVVEYSENIDFRYEYLLEALVCLGMILYFYSRIPKKTEQIVMLNIALAFCALLLIFIHSENGGRLAWYYMIGLIATFTTLDTRKRTVSYYNLSIILLSFILYFRIIYSWGILLTPYKTFLTDGIRDGDYIEEKYEYDHGYDVDKFYR